MLKRLLGARGFMSAAVVLTVVVIAVVGFRLARPTPEMRGYCAEMPDSIGLYVGSAVTVLGVPIGRVTSIRPNGGTAHVEFSIPAQRRLPTDVGAVTVSDSIVADRKLALIGPEPSGPEWDSGRCITNTLTPRSLSQTFDALSELVAQLDGGDATTRPGALNALAEATAGSAESINTLILRLGSALDAPDAAIGHLGALLDRMAELARKANLRWPEIETSVSGLPRAFIDINEHIIAPIELLVDSIAEVLPQGNDLIRMLGSPGLRAIDGFSNLPRLLSVGIGSLTEIVRMTPAITTAFATAVDPATGQVVTGYTPAHLELPQHEASAVCAALRSITEQQCRVSATGATEIPALPLLLEAVSAR
ncbi:MlaD family protein [Nocardia bovistercoris]|uniref:MCE family protein n=1 Tax=Nocardia bovistercoris TaxID=2785916 RepID=A0A931N3R7_9NOCA|nr:MlaD family protein [Nocardia bovistercoris]MBH0778012.1 MCE family protein [Nocardia bovistercoris]